MFCFINQISLFKFEPPQKLQYMKDELQAAAIEIPLIGWTHRSFVGDDDFTKD